MTCGVCGREPCARWCSTAVKTRWARRDSGSAVLSMVRAARRYAVAYSDLYGGKLADDAVLGPPFRDILSSLCQLLNGELGGQDGGNLDRDIRQVAAYAGFEEEL